MNLQYMGKEIFIQNKRVHASFEKLVRGNTETATPHYRKGMQKFYSDGQFSKYVLSGITEIIKANI